MSPADAQSDPFNLFAVHEVPKSLGISIESLQWRKTKSRRCVCVPHQSTAYLSEQGSAVPWTSRKRANRRQSFHSGISHDLLERKGNLPRVVARTQTVYPHQACVRAKFPKMGPRLAAANRKLVSA